MSAEKDTSLVLCVKNPPENEANPEKKNQINNSLCCIPSLPKPVLTGFLRCVIERITRNTVFPFTCRWFPASLSTEIMCFFQGISSFDSRFMVIMPLQVAYELSGPPI